VNQNHMKINRCLIAVASLLFSSLSGAGAADGLVPALEVVGEAGRGQQAKVPYHGIVAAVNAEAGTFTLKGKEKERLFRVAAGTRILRDGNLAALGTIRLGEEVRGQATRGGEAWDAVSVFVGARPEGESKMRKPAAVKEPKVQ
jgi:hypothetical protein